MLIRGSSCGHVRAQAGSGLSSLVIVRSTDGRMVVDSVAVLVTPTFLMLPWTVAVLKMFDPAGPMTMPRIVIVIVPPALSDRIEQTTSGALTTHPPPVPIAPFTMTWLAMMLDASRNWVVSLTRTSSAREVALLTTWIL